MNLGRKVLRRFEWEAEWKGNLLQLQSTSCFDMGM